MADPSRIYRWERDVTFTDQLIVYAFGMFLLGLLVLCLGLVFRRTAVDDPTPDHDDLTELLDAVQAGAMVPAHHPLARVHQECALAWKDHDYHNVRDCCFDLLGRSADVGLDIFEVTQ